MFASLALLMGWLTELARMLRVDFVVAAYSKDMMEQALQVAESIRLAGASADVMLEPKRKVWQVRVCICITGMCPCMCLPGGLCLSFCLSLSMCLCQSVLCV